MLYLFGSRTFAMVHTSKMNYHVIARQRENIQERTCYIIIIGIIIIIIIDV